MWHGCSGYEWMRACVYELRGVLMFEYDTKGVLLSIGTTEAFG